MAAIAAIVCGVGWVVTSIAGGGVIIHQHGVIARQHTEIEECKEELKKTKGELDRAKVAINELIESSKKIKEEADAWKNRAWNENTLLKSVIDELTKKGDYKLAFEIMNAQSTGKLVIQN